MAYEARDEASDPWQVDDGAFPAAGTPERKLRFLVHYAVLAPSSHNTQPWLFRIGNECLDLLADRTRALPVVDPEDRALTISCGAALGMLRVALRNFGHAGNVRLLPDAADPDLLARVGLGRGEAPTPEERALFRAIVRRRTTRRRFEDRPLPEHLIRSLHAAAEAEGVELAVVTDPPARARIAELVSEGDRIQFGDPSFRRELAAWVHSRRAASRDGMSGSGFGMPDLLSAAGALVIRSFDIGNGVAAKDEAVAAGSPALAVLATEGDEPRTWLAAGQALARVLLTATAAGVTAAYLNQPVEVPSLRPRLRERAGVEGAPQLLLRLGYGPEIAPAVRRPVEAVLQG